MTNRKIGLALSGGGYRATIFHVGTLRALYKMNILQKIDVISTISGGSITGAAYCLSKQDYVDFDATMLDAICTKSVIQYILTSWVAIRTAIFLLAFLVPAIWLQFRGYSWISIILIFALLALILLFQFRIFPISKIIERAYDEFFLHGATLGDLPEKPLLAIGSTNLQTCRPFTFSTTKMEDSYYAFLKPPIFFKHKEFPVSKAVMASTCVPFAFAPVCIDAKYYQDPKDVKRGRPVLVDGGIYDNQGIQKITQPKSHYECGYIITSDAGSRLPFEKKYNNTWVILLRTVDTFMTRIKNFQMAQQLFQLANLKTKEVAYLSLGWDISSCIPGFISNLKSGTVMEQVISAHKIPAAWVADVDRYETAIRQLLEQNVGYSAIHVNDLTPKQLKIARKVTTNLKKLPLESAELLARHAANLTELQVKLYCPDIIDTLTL